MELHLYTAQIGKYKGPDAYDVTVKSGDINFAPTWDMVKAWKAGEITWENYSQRYRELMLRSYKRNQRAWQEILEKGVLTLLCYCRADDHCHRYLLADFLSKLGEKSGINVINEGERIVQVKEEASNTKDKDRSILVSNQQNLF
jgi:uncharacterized protein YeaO (DUF488 family)